MKSERYLNIDAFLDVTDQKCPMTFVKTKLFLETLQQGQLAEIKLLEGEALDNMPTTLEHENHVIRLLEPDPGSGKGVYRMIVEVA